jgi:hypothetical protein
MSSTLADVSLKVLVQDFGLCFKANIAGVCDMGQEHGGDLNSALDAYYNMYNTLGAL